MKVPLYAAGVRQRGQRSGATKVRARRIQKREDRGCDVAVLGQGKAIDRCGRGGQEASHAGLQGATPAIRARQT